MNHSEKNSPPQPCNSCSQISRARRRTPRGGPARVAGRPVVPSGQEQHAGAPGAAAGGGAGGGRGGVAGGPGLRRGPRLPARRPRPPGAPSAPARPGPRPPPLGPSVHRRRASPPQRSRLPPQRTAPAPPLAAPGPSPSRLRRLGFRETLPSRAAEAAGALGGAGEDGARAGEARQALHWAPRRSPITIRSPPPSSSRPKRGHARRRRD